MDFPRELEQWHDFYVLVGTAGATLVALLFVAVSLGTGYLTTARAAGTRAFFSPVVIHFTNVFLISAISLVPSHGGQFFAALIGLCALGGLAAACYATVQIVRNDWTRYLGDYLSYGLLPVLTYLALLTAVVMIWRGDGMPLEIIAGGLLVLLIVNIRNAWDLMLDMVRRHGED